MSYDVMGGRNGSFHKPLNISLGISDNMIYKWNEQEVPRKSFVTLSWTWIFSKVMSPTNVKKVGVITMS